MHAEAGGLGDDDRRGRRRFFRAAALGAGLGGLVFLLVLLGGSHSLLARDPGGQFYDLQAHSLADLRWNIPTNSIGIEGVVVDGKTYEYFGPVPALLRLPVAAVTDTLDGRLSRLSMLLAFAVALTFTVRLAWRVRGLVRGEHPVTRTEVGAVGLFTFVVGAGSALLFLASRAAIFHEALLWGAAFAIGAFELLIAYVSKPRGRYLAGACLCASLALLTRVTVGAGPVAAIGILLLASLMPRGRKGFGLPEQVETRKLALPLAAAVAVPVALAAYVNYAKFGSFFSIPLDQQVLSLFNVNRRATLAANGNGLFNVNFLPTAILQYFRPDAIRLSSLFPWVTFPHAATVIGGAHFDELGATSSIPASMPLLALLGLGGLVGVVRPPKTSGPTLAAVRGPVIGAALGFVLTMSFAVITQRYLSDAMPVIVLLAVTGLFLLVRWVEALPERQRGRKRAVWAGVAGLALLSVWFSFGFAYLYQRQISDTVTQARRAQSVNLQYRLHETLPGGLGPHVTTGGQLPRPGARGTVYVLSGCRGVYWSDGTQWRPLQRTPATGEHRLRVTFEDVPVGTVEPIVVGRARRGGQFIVARRIDPNHVQFEYLVPAIGLSLVGQPVRITPGEPRDVRIVMDDRSGEADVDVDGRNVLSVEGVASITNIRLMKKFVKPVRDVQIGSNSLGGPAARRHTGLIKVLPPLRPVQRLCGGRTQAARG